MLENLKSTNNKNVNKQIGKNYLKKFIKEINVQFVLKNTKKMTKFI